MKAVTAKRATQALIVLETALVAAPKHSARSRHGPARERMPEAYKSSAATFITSLRDPHIIPPRQ